MVYNGEKFFGKKIIKRLNRNEETIKNYKQSGLTNREIEILTLLKLGFRNKEISGKFFISIKTVEAHKENIKNKLKVEHCRDLI